MKKSMNSNKKEPLIKHERTSIDELEKRIMNNSGRFKSINEGASFKDRLNQPISYRYDWVIRNLPEGDELKVLDVGCWTGMMSYLLKECGHKVTASDTNEKCLELVNKNVDSISTVKSDVTSLPFKDNTYDVVIALQLIEHVKDDNKALYEMYRVLKSGGKLIVTTPIQKNLLAKEHEHFYNFYDLMDLFDEFGSSYTITKLHKFKKYSRPKNIFGVIYTKGVDENE